MGPGTITSINREFYELLRSDLRLSEGRSYDFMRILDTEYKSGIREDLAVLTKQMNQGFERMDGRFLAQDKRMDGLDKRIDGLEIRIDGIDKKIDFKTGDLGKELRIEMRDMKFDLVKWMIGFFVGLALLILGSYLKR